MPWVALGLFAVALALGGVTFAVFASSGDGDSKVVAPPSTSTSTSSTPTSSTTTPTTTAVAFTPIIPSTTTTVHATSSAAGGISAPQSGWITLVASLAQSQTSAGAAVAYADGWRSRGYAVDVLDSNHYSSLRDGYWIAYLGPVADQGSAQTECNSLRASGTSSDCYVRQLIPG